MGRSWSYNGSIQKLGYGFLFVFHSNYGRIFTRVDPIKERDRHLATARQRKPRLCIASRGRNVSCCFSFSPNAQIKCRRTFTV